MFRLIFCCWTLCFVYIELCEAEEVDQWRLKNQYLYISRLFTEGRKVGGSEVLDASFNLYHWDWRFHTDLMLIMTSVHHLKALLIFFFATINQAYFSACQGVPNSTIPRRQKPRRVDLYYSSWCIRAGNQFDMFSAKNWLIFVIGWMTTLGGFFVFAVIVKWLLQVFYHYVTSQKQL